MFTDIQLVFKKLSKNVAMPYVKLLNKLIRVVLVKSF